MCKKFIKQRLLSCNKIIKFLKNIRMIIFSFPFYNFIFVVKLKLKIIYNLF